MIKALIALPMILLTPLAHVDIAGQGEPLCMSARILWLYGQDAETLTTPFALTTKGNT